MTFWEALILGSISQPICKYAFIGPDGAGCLVTAAVRAAGRRPKSATEVVEDALELWPWLRTTVQPMRSAKDRYTGKTFQTRRPDSRALVGLMRHSMVIHWVACQHDMTVADVAFIADQIRDLEEYVATPKSEYLERVNHPSVVEVA